MLQRLATCARRDDATICLNGGGPPFDLPHGYVGPAWLPGTGRMIWWTGRVAIGLRHQAGDGAPAAAALAAGVDRRLNPG